MTIWFTSDLHLGHGNIIDYCNRPFRDAGGNPDIPMQTEVLVRNWIERVSPDDVVFCLGDMVMGQREKTLPLLARLNGHKTLVMGNHDYCWPHLWKPSQAEKAARWKDAYIPYFEAMSLHGRLELANGVEVYLHHFPYVGDSHGEDRYANHRPVDFGTPLLHGHVHDAWKTATSPAGTPMVNVGVDVHDFAPVSEAEIISLLGG